MIQQHAAQPHLAVLSQVRTPSRLFTLTWTNARLCIAHHERLRRHECEGTHYANGVITLDNGSSYTTMYEMTHTLELAGPYEITYHDEQDQAEHDA